MNEQFVQFLATKNKSRDLLFRGFPEIALRPLFMEKLIRTWLRGFDKGLTMAVVREDGVEGFVISVDESEKPLAFARLPLPSVLKIYGKFAPLPEKAYRYADQPGSTPNIEWFERRDRRLGLKWNDDFDCRIIPARALGELILSYCFSSGGMVRVRKDLDEDRRCRITELYRFTFAFFGGNADYGWEEKGIVLRDRLEHYIARNEKENS